MTNYYNGLCLKNICGYILLLESRKKSFKKISIKKKNLFYISAKFYWKDYLLFSKLFILDHAESIVQLKRQPARRGGGYNLVVIIFHVGIPMIMY